MINRGDLRTLREQYLALVKRLKRLDERLTALEEKELGVKP